MKKILITGGAGFVGRHFVRRFLESGDEVHCVDNIAPLTGGIDPYKGWPFFNPLEFSNFHYYNEDCRSYFQRVQDVDFDYCFHLAAIVGGRLVIENNPLAVADDLSIDAYYWQWALHTKPRKTICFSSSAVYPIKYQQRESYTLLTEDMISFEQDLGMPDLSYGWSKLTHEYLAQLAFEKYGLRSVTYRPFSGYGEDQDDSYPFPSICKRAIQHQGEPILYVWGTGDQMRDFIHIEDCVDGVVSTMDKINDGGAVHLSTGIYTSFKDLAHLAAQVCGYLPKIRGMTDKPSGVFARAGDTAKQKSMGIEYKTDLRSGVGKALEYLSEQRNLL